MSSYSRRHIRASFYFICGLATASAYAESITTLDPITIKQADPGYSFDTASVATRTTTSTKDAPYSIGVISSPLLQDSQAQRLEDLALFVSGVQQSSADSGFNTDLTIRGFSTGGATYLNGLLDNQKFQVRDLALVERVEILKGHSSVLYGAGNPGGTVNYITKKPETVGKHNVSAALGNYDYRRLVADSTGPLNQSGSVLYRMVAAGQFSNDFRKNITNDSAVLAPSLSWQYNDKGSITAEFEYSYRNQPYRFDNVFTRNQIIYDRSYVDPRAQSDRNYWRFSTSAVHQLSSTWSAYFSSHYYHVERHDVLFGFFTFTTPDTLSGYYRNIHDHYDQINLRSELHGNLFLLGGKHHLIFGVERNSSNDRLNSQRRIGGFTLNIYQPNFDHPIPASTALNGDTNKQEYGAYSYDEINLNRYWHLTGGFRYSLFDALENKNLTTNQSALTFNAGVVFKPINAVSSYFGYSQSFQPNYGMSRDHAFLPAKQGELLEWGVKSNFFKQRLDLSAAIYRLSQNNLTARDPSDPDYLITNGEVQSRGLELNLSGHLSERLELLSNYSFAKAEFTEHDQFQGNAFRNTPEHSGAVWGKYRLPVPRLSGDLYLGGGTTFVDKRKGDDANSFEVPGYIRADLFAHYSVDNLNFRLKVENLFDKRYVSSSNYDDTVIQANRRLIQILASIKFM